MLRRIVLLSFLLLAGLVCFSMIGRAQVDTVPHTNQAPGQNQSPPRYERDKEAGESSSRDTKIDLSPPANDTKDHPFSDASSTNSGGNENSGEFHPWDPHKAAKDVEVGDFYFKRKNYHAALARYQDALLWKDNDAEATFHLALCYEKVNEPAEAAKQYERYLNILPHGPYAGESQKALDRLKGKDRNQTASGETQVPAVSSQR